MVRIWTGLLAMGVLGCDGKGGDGEDLIDNDGDGALAEVDCDDGDAAIFPGAVELCDSIDNDCDAEVDEDATDGSVFYADMDGDGFGAGLEVMLCTAQDGYVDNAEDCDDSSADALPGGTEVCDGHDNDCDGDVDGTAIDMSTYYPDLDADGYGNGANGRDSCAPPDNFVDNGDDCDDSRASLNPETRWYPDGDGDTYGSPVGFVVTCTQPSGYVNNLDDCVDDDPTIFPGQVLENAKLCLIDLDLDGFGDANPPAGIDAGTDCDDSSSRTFPGASTEDPTLCMADEDFDGYGDANPPKGVSAGTDCDDSNDATYPGAGAEDVTKCMADSDGDSYGDDNPPAGVDAGTDCDDQDASQYPGATETCNSEDDDCNGQRDDNPSGATSYYEDDDGDGYGDSSAVTSACFQPAFTSTTGGDCDDTDSAIYPAAPEDCTDGVDNNCNSKTDEVCTYTQADADVSLTYNVTTYDYFGQATAIGDVTGDGYGDAIVGAYAADPTGASSGGKVYVIEGPLTSGSTINAVSAASTVVSGSTSNTYLGYRTKADDLDGDGYEDLIAGGYYYSSGKGGIFVYYGPVTTAALTASGADSIISGSSVSGSEYLAYTLMETVDMDSDGKAEVLGGAYIYNSYRGYVAGYEAPTGSKTLSSATYAVTGTSTNDYIGYSGDAGDFNGDGDLDMVFGSPYYNEKTYIINGPVTSTSLTRSSADVTISHYTTYDYTGSQVAAGDFDGDGNDDLVMGSYYDDIGNTFTGATSYSMGAYYIFYGPITSNLTDKTDYDALLYETTSYDYLSGPFYGDLEVVDMDGDGADELLIGSSYDDLGSSNGGSIYGYTGALSGAMEFGSDYTIAITYTTASQYFARQLETGDVDDDGLPDIISGSYYANSYYGGAYVFFGSNF